MRNQESTKAGNLKQETPDPQKRSIVIATRNPGKAREFCELLGAEFEVSDLGTHPEVPEIEETGQTFVENATLKAIAGSQKLSGLVLGDDSGLEVDALNGAPGVYSARYAGEKASARENIAKLRDDLVLCCREQRTARFRCALVLAQDGKILETVEAVLEGRIIDLPRGSDGFGYDPVFEPEGYAQTLGELPAKIKNRISHRGRAVEELRRRLGGATDSVAK